MPAREEVGRCRLLEAAHGIEPLLQVAMIAFQSIVQIRRGPMRGRWQDGAQGWRIARRLIRGELHRRHVRRSDGAKVCAALALRRSEKEASTTWPC